MPKTLYSKLAVILLGLIGVIGAIYVLSTLLTTRMYLNEVNQRLNRTLAEHLASEKIPMAGGEVNEEALKEIFHLLMVINPSIEVYLLDPEGNILAYSAPPDKVKLRRVSLEPIRRFLAGTAPLPITGDDPRNFERQKVFSVAPIAVGDRLDGYLYVILGGEEYDSVAQMLEGSYILRLSLWTAAGGLVFALAAGLFLFRLSTRRLRKLASTMQAFKQGDFREHPEPKAQVRDRPRDEIDELERTFHEMAGRIAEQMNKLKQTDTLRRELVANVSHDLRTPLASLQGYLETLLLKEGQLSPEEQRNYLEVAAKHSERLGILVAELFELAKLDSREVQIHVEPFSLGELVQDVIQKFRLTAEKKGVKLHADFIRDLPFVIADIGLIERVLENLIENALRYTPEHGTVTVALAPSEEKITVRVTDTGGGIAPEDLPYIFDRFYRGAKNEKGSSGSAGLGLAITKRILELHGSSIQAESKVGAGTTFTFDLPIDKALT
jgi:signal transduction histidine kinase